MSNFNMMESLPHIKNKKYDLGISQLTFLISQQPNDHLLSTLYSNRGTLYLASGRLTQAIDDLLRSLQANHLNYPAYFNLFSIYSLSNNILEALRNMCCALSCLFLLRGKLNKNQTDLTKAIKYAENNVEARLLKGIMNMEKKKYRIALNEINWAIQLQPQNQKIHVIKSRILKLIQDQDSTKGATRYSKGTGQSPQKREEASQEVKVKILRLECLTYDEEGENFNVGEQLQKKLSEFNELYNQLNGDYTSIISREPMIHLLQKSDKSKTLESKLGKNQMVSSLVVEEEKESESSEIKIEKKGFDFSRVDETQSLDGGDDENMYPQQPQKFNLQGHLLNSESVHSKSRSDAKDKSESRYSQTPQNISTFTLQALEEGKSISIKVHNIEMKQDAQKYTNLYCKFDYGEKQGKQLSNESFQAELQDEPQVLHVKVFNKEVLAFNDTFIGEGFKEITMTGRIQVPVFLQQQTNIIGKATLDIKFK